MRVNGFLQNFSGFCERVNSNDARIKPYCLRREYKGDKMIPGSKGRKFDESLLSGEFLNLGPAKNMKKQPDRADFECF